MKIIINSCIILCVLISLSSKAQEGSPKTHSTYHLKINNKKVVLIGGMSMQEVQAILGTNYREQPDKELNCERWIYSQITKNKKSVRVRFKNKLLQYVTVYREPS